MPLTYQARTLLGEYHFEDLPREGDWITLPEGTRFEVRMISWEWDDDLVNAQPHIMGYPR